MSSIPAALVPDGPLPDGSTSSVVPFLDLATTHQAMRGELLAAFARVLDGGVFIGGAEVEAFEEAFAGYCGVRHAVAVGNGLDALHLILRAYGIGPGDEVLVPSNTFIATWLAVSLVGATPVPVEPCATTYNMDPAAIAAAVTPRTRAVIPVHLYGQPADMTAIATVARRHGLLVIEDAAQAHGARLHERRAGALGDAAAFSFYPGKNLGALGDGGAVTTDDSALAERLRLARSYGSRRKYHHETVGLNSRLDPVQAAVLSTKLPHLDRWNAHRSAMAQRYRAGLAGIPGLVLPAILPSSEPVWHLFVVRHRLRDELQAHLNSEGIGTLIHYPIPPHRTGAYAGLGLAKGRFPVAEELADSVLSLPMGPAMDAATVDRVCEAVARFPATD